MPGDKSHVSAHEGDVPVGEMVIVEIPMIPRAGLKDPIGERTEEESQEEKMGHIEYKDARHKNNEEHPTDELFGSHFTEKDGEGVDSIDLVPRDVFEVLDGKEKRVGDKEESRNRPGKGSDALFGRENGIATEENEETRS